MKDEIKEEDLYPPVKEYFQALGYKVNGEVRGCDITALKEEELIIIELKKNLTVNLLTQAVIRQRTADLVYIAIPKPKRFKINAKWKDTLHLLRRLELGLILVHIKDGLSTVEVVQEPVPFDRNKSIQLNKKKRKLLIKEIEGRNIDLNKGGSRGKKLVTAYREAAILIASCLDLYGPLSTKELRSLGSDNKKTTSILNQNYYGWFERLEKGVYKLTEEGKKDLQQYPELVKYYKDKIKNKVMEADKIANR
ncbi:MAG: hypothetical protein GX895_04140 [Clostridiales bacterium]|nr:hypothetical protein [Clostridiales bacterium]